MNTTLIPVEANPNLVRDMKSGTILNMDRSSYHSYMEQKRLRSAKQQEVQQQLNTMQDELAQIKKQLSMLLAQGNSQ